MTRGSVILALVLVPILARADALSEAVAKQFVELLLPYGVGVPPENAAAPRLVMNDEILVSAGYEQALGGWGHHPSGERKQLVGVSADRKTAWAAFDVDFANLCGMAECMHDPPVAVAHALGLFEQGKKIAWQPIAWDLERILPAKLAAAAQRKPLPAMPKGIDAGAEDVAKWMVVALADPAALGKAISDRADALLYGSELAERYVGGSTVRATLAKWKLGFKVHDGIQAGLASSKTHAFFAANVDAARPGDKSSLPYRLFAILEKSGADWRIVALSFGVHGE